jgi:hypothetical protein
MKQGSSHIGLFDLLYNELPYSLIVEEEEEERKRGREIENKRKNRCIE